MIEIDGSRGGGQMLRSALSLSAITQEAFRIENIRGSRPNPGLKNQHMEAVKAIARVCDAKVEGLEDGSEKLEFRPRDLKPENFSVNIGTAGSVTLLLDTLLPVSSQFDTSFRVDVKGGTDVKWSPTVEYFRNVKLPMLRGFGVSAELELKRTGFYPAGGGEVRLETEPHSLESSEILERGEIKGFEVFSSASQELEQQSVAERQADEAARKLKNSHISVPVEKQVGYVDTDSPGSSLLVKAVYDNSVAGFSSLGEKGKRSEKVANEAVKEFKSFHSSDAAVDRYLADQLIIFLAVAGGGVAVPELTDHVQTSIGVVEKFGFNVDIEGGERVVLSG